MVKPIRDFRARPKVCTGGGWGRFSSRRFVNALCQSVGDNDRARELERQYREAYDAHFAGLPASIGHITRSLRAGERGIHAALSFEEGMTMLRNLGETGERPTRGEIKRWVYNRRTEGGRWLAMTVTAEQAATLAQGEQLENLERLHEHAPKEYSPRISEYLKS